MENVIMQSSTSAETFSNASANAIGPTIEVTSHQDRNETQDVSNLSTTKVSSQVSQNDNTGGELEALNAASCPDTDQASADKIAFAWRSYRKSRERRGKILSAKSRDELKKSKDDGMCLHLPGTCKVWEHWEELLDAVEEQIHKSKAMKGPQNKLELAVSVVERIGKGSSKNHLWLILDTEHWLEICDNKHRYGSNLKVYHDYWLHTNTQQDFFSWLDNGDGKELSFENCTRNKLESQQVKYLKSEERLDYEVTFKDGLLIYKKSGRPVHTNPTESSGTASLPISPVCALPPTLSLAGSPKETGGEQSTTHPTHSRNESETNNGSVREKWIYVTDCDEKFYVGRKIKGHFHHSSFLAGGAICAAGGIKVRDGKLLGITPNSGHYKPAQYHFKALIARLRKEGVDVDGEEVKVTYPNDILEHQLLGKYKFKRLVHLNMVCDAVVRDAGNMVNQQFDSVDRHFTKASNIIKKNMTSLLREGKESLREWVCVKNSESIDSNVQPAVRSIDKDKTKGKPERNLGGFVLEILTGFALFFSTPVDQVDVKRSSSLKSAKKDNDERDEREISSGGSVV